MIDRHRGMPMNPLTLRWHIHKMSLIFITQRDIQKFSCPGPSNSPPHLFASYFLSMYPTD